MKACGLGDVRLELMAGDITTQPDIDAIVNAANAWLAPGGGVAGAIHAAAGPGLARECAALAPIEPGQAVLTAAHWLPNRYVIHCLGPVYGRDMPSDRLLGECYRNALLIAEQNALESIAFPSIATGAFRYPREEAAEIALNTVMGMAAALTSVNVVRFVLYEDAALGVYESVLERLTG